jgi:Arc/MetJ-type ribon-helix-helix transcriptional regulator
MCSYVLGCPKQSLRYLSYTTVQHGEYKRKKIPDDMAEDTDEAAETSGRYLNQSEYVRDAIRHRLEEHPPRLSEETLRDIAISEQQIERGETRSLEDIKEKYGVDD